MNILNVLAEGVYVGSGALVIILIVILLFLVLR